MNFAFNKNKTILSSLGLILTAAIWGFAFVVVKDSLSYIGPVWMIAFRFTIAVIVLSLAFIKHFKNFNLKYLAHGAVLGILIFFAYFFQTVGCKYTTAGKNAFLTTTYVILVPLISWPLYKKRPEWFVFLAAIMCMAGIAFLSLGGESASFSSEKPWYYMNAGDLFTLISGLFYGIHIICISHYSQKEDPILLTILQFAFTDFCAWCVSPFYDGAFPLEAFKNFRVMASLLYLGLFSTMLAYLLQNVALKYVPSALGSLFMSLESVFGVLFSALFLHEALGLRMYLGCSLIFGAIVLTEVFPSLLKKQS